MRLSQDQLLGYGRWIVRNDPRTIEGLSPGQRKFIRKWHIVIKKRGNFLHVREAITSDGESLSVAEAKARELIHGRILWAKVPLKAKTKAKKNRSLVKA